VWVRQTLTFCGLTAASTIVLVATANLAAGNGAPQWAQNLLWALWATTLIVLVSVMLLLIRLDSLKEQVSSLKQIIERQSQGEADRGRQ
jgi:hypothetical protein